MPAQVQNISRAGLYLTTDTVPRLGAPVRCRFRLGRQPRELQGRVAWVARSRSEPGFESTGAGIEFTDLSQDDEAALAEVTQAIGQAAPHASAPIENLSVWFEGLTTPVRTQGNVTPDEIVVTTLLPFLRVGSDVKVGIAGDDGLHYRYARIEGLALDSLQPDEPPRIVVKMRATDAVLKEAGELSTAMRSRGEAFFDSKPVRRTGSTNPNLPPLSAAHGALTPSPQLLGDPPPGMAKALSSLPSPVPEARRDRHTQEFGSSRPRSATPPPVPRSLTPPPRLPTPPPLPVPQTAALITPSAPVPAAATSRSSELPAQHVPLGLAPTIPVARQSTAKIRRLPWRGASVVMVGVLVGMVAMTFVFTRKPLPKPDPQAAFVAPQSEIRPQVTRTATPPTRPRLEIAVDVTPKVADVPAPRAAAFAPRPAPANVPAAKDEPGPAEAEPESPSVAAADEPPPSPETNAAAPPSQETNAGAPPSSTDILEAAPPESAAPPPAAPDNEIPPPPKFLRAPFSLTQDSDSTTVVVPLMGSSRPTEVLALAPQPGVVAILTKAKLPLRPAVYNVKHPVITFVSLETRPLGVYVRVLFGPKAAGYKLSNSLGELRITVSHKH